MSTVEKIVALLRQARQDASYYPESDCDSLHLMTLGEEWMADAHEALAAYDAEQKA